jgi:hypothetical protein
LVEDLDHIPRDSTYGKVFSRNGFRRSWTITANPSHLSDPNSRTSATTSTPLAQLHVSDLGSPPEQPVVGLASADVSSLSLEEDQDNLFSSAEFTEPINLAVAAKDLKLAVLPEAMKILDDAATSC